MHPNQEPKFNIIFAPIETTYGIVYSDQNGHLPCVSSKGNRYIMVIYCMDANTILSQHMKIISETELVTSYTTI